MKPLLRRWGGWLLPACVVVAATGGCLNPRPEELPSADQAEPVVPGFNGSDMDPGLPPSPGADPSTEGAPRPAGEDSTDDGSIDDEGAEFPADAGARALGLPGQTSPLDEPEPPGSADAGVAADGSCPP